MFQREEKKSYLPQEFYNLQRFVLHFHKSPYPMKVLKPCFESFMLCLKVIYAFTYFPFSKKGNVVHSLAKCLQELLLFQLLYGMGTRRYYDGHDQTQYKNLTTKLIKQSLTAQHIKYKLIFSLKCKSRRFGQSQWTPIKRVQKLLVLVKGFTLKQQNSMHTELEDNLRWKLEYRVLQLNFPSYPHQMKW